ncbi:acetyl-CoA C-acetyltransferase [Desulfacinum hydrothermale DSM 13146]|uniref:Acetyl-CoA C-acetyltransferase n=1 Tax=Desulfacinum hydrothermale DSM 13146 TaxID=1121390 RepID=A0A1W1WZL4_9BACT|nr:acetyl-CoA acetyltransferase [Desulfacinum hydrothermale]SMC17085.1 acetyl-CoA C-acetyltransferase [Desulfacinum hydrothermale DSM 13146]
MATGIKDKVAILGMGCTRFGERWNDGAEDLMVEAFQEALQDAGIEKHEIEAAWLGTCFDEVNIGKSAIPMAQALKLPNIPVTRVENFCATGTEAFRGACYAVASGACRIALALGVEKLKDTGYGGLPGFDTAMGTLNRFILPNFTAPGGFALMATRYFAKYGISPEEGKMALAKISTKSHRCGALNPKAHLRKEISPEQVLKAPIIAWPLGLFDCCGVSDGAAAAIVTTPDVARAFQKNPVLVKSLQIAATSGEEMLTTRWDGTYLKTTTEAAKRAYAEAGIAKPREELSVLEVHDCFSITELVTYEDLQISERGRAIRDINEGFFDLEGKIPCQSDGGLKCFGHPIGASGIRMIYEVYNQLLHRAGPRQIPDPRLGLTHNLGGIPSFSVCSVGIFGL